MKKIISLVSAIAMIASVGTTANAEETYLKGDFNGDGVVDYNDFGDYKYAYSKSLSKVSESKWGNSIAFKEETMNYFKNDNKLNDEKVLSLDLYNDGNLDLNDAVYLLRYVCVLHFGYTGDYNFDVVNEYYNNLDSSKLDAYEAEAKAAYDKAHPVEVISEPDPEPSLGDVNGDKQIDSKDAIAVLKYYAASLTSEESKVENYQWIAEYGDYNKDGAVDAKDAVAIIRAYADYMAGNN